MTLLAGPCTWICSCVGSLGASQLVLGPMSATVGHLSVSASQRGRVLQIRSEHAASKRPFSLSGSTGYHAIPEVAVCGLSMHQIFRRAQMNLPFKVLVECAPLQLQQT